VHVYGYCLICFETLYGFDHPVGYLYNKPAASFVLKQDPDLLVLFAQEFYIVYPDPLAHCIPSTSKLRLPLGIRVFHGISASRVIFGDNFRFRESFRENFGYFRNFS
jgi:hypothetical protein